jgi:hypothetical protein
MGSIAPLSRYTLLSYSRSPVAILKPSCSIMPLPQLIIATRLLNKTRLLVVPEYPSRLLFPSGLYMVPDVAVMHDIGTTEHGSLKASTIRTDLILL